MLAARLAEDSAEAHSCLGHTIKGRGYQSFAVPVASATLLGPTQARCQLSLVCQHARQRPDPRCGLFLPGTQPWLVFLGTCSCAW